MEEGEGLMDVVGEIGEGVIQQAISDFIRGERGRYVKGFYRQNYETAKEFLFGDGDWQESLKFWCLHIGVDIEDVRELAITALIKERGLRRRYKTNKRGMAWKR